MNKKLSRLFSPGMTVSFVVLALFCVIAWFTLHKAVAILLTAAGLGTLIYYHIRDFSRKKDIARYLQDASFSVDSVSNEQMSLPLPAMILNLTGGEIMWCNEAFQQVVGTEESLFEEKLSDFFPEMTTDWLSEGKTVCPEPVRRGERRFRVYGDHIRTQEGTAAYLAGRAGATGSTAT